MILQKVEKSKCSHTNCAHLILDDSKLCYFHRHKSIFVKFLYYLSHTKKISYDNRNIKYSKCLYKNMLKELIGVNGCWTNHEPMNLSLKTRARIPNCLKKISNLYEYQGKTTLIFWLFWSSYKSIKKIKKIFDPYTNFLILFWSFWYFYMKIKIIKKPKFFFALIFI